MKHASLFSGIGGFDIAAEWSGWANQFWCEFDPFCQKVLEYHFPKSKGYGDIKKADFREWRGAIDVLSAGFPCQPFSTAGQRKGAEDDRYLWPQVCRVIDEVRPRWVVGENVAGLMSMVFPPEEVRVAEQATLFGEDYTVHEERGAYILHTILNDLEERGYSVQTFIIPALSVGAPHRRDRLWVVAHTASPRGGECVRADGGGQESDTLRHGGHGAGLLSELREDGGDESTTDPHSNGREQRWGGSAIHRSNEAPSERTQVFGKSQRPSEEQPLADTSGGWRGDEVPLSEEERADSRTSYERAGACHRLLQHDGRGWERFPTQSPLCGGDDGLSLGLDTLSFPSWRRASLKAYGNAIVPEVARRIFEAIDKIENSIYE